MSDSSRRSHQVTVTLGRSGRVVKRAGGLSDEEFRNELPIVGSKRSIKDRLGGNIEDKSGSYNKRQREESTSDSIDMCLGKDDLRFKLMQKSSGRESQNSESWRNVDLRDKLSSRNSRPSADSMTMRPPESAASTQYPVVDPRVSGMTRHPVLESRDTTTLRRLPPSRNPSELSGIGPPRSYPSRTSEKLHRQRSPDNLRRRSPENMRQISPEVARQRSPEVVLRRRSPERLYAPSAARGPSPQRNREELQRRQVIRSYDDGRSASYVGISPLGAVRSSPYLTQSIVPAPVKSVVPVSHYPQAGGIVQRIPTSVDVPPTVDSLLQSLGLEKYAIYFKAEEVDMNALKQLGDSDLKDLGIPMGPRKKILQAVMPRARRQM